MRAPVLTVGDGALGFWNALSEASPPSWSSNPDGSPAGGALLQLQAPLSLGTVAPNGEKTTYAQLQDMHFTQEQAS
jgi:hypothetical protein